MTQYGHLIFNNLLKHLNMKVPSYCPLHYPSMPHVHVGALTWQVHSLILVWSLRSEAHIFFFAFTNPVYLAPCYCSPEGMFFTGLQFEYILLNNTHTQHIKSVILFISHDFVFQVFYPSHAGGGVGIAKFNLATADAQHPEVRPLTTYVLPCNLKTKPI